MIAFQGLTIVALSLMAIQAAAQSTLTGASAFDTLLAPTQTHEYVLELRAGQSANVTIRQMGVDVVVEVRDPSDSMLARVDSPNGRQGDEPVEIMASRSGRYKLRVFPFDAAEPEGRYRVQVIAIRTVAGTRALLAARASARDSAATWLRQRSGRLAATPSRLDARAAALFDEMALKARVLGLGEATHGSREFGDMRLALTRRAVEQSGYRIVAIEASAMRLDRLNAYINNIAPAAALQLVENGWIGRRTLRELVVWLRSWNDAHPDDRVRLVGVDAQDFLIVLPAVRAALLRVYGEAVSALWQPLERELATADSQSAVFGNSRVRPGVRDTLFIVANAVALDAAVIRGLHGDSTYRLLASALRSFSEFAAFNSGSAQLTHSRDWYMAASVLRALEEGGPRSKALYWAHNAHVAHPERAPASNVSGGVLRASLGCGYQAVALTFGEGSFTAQRPNDAAFRLEVSTLPKKPVESIEDVAGMAAGGDAFFSWGCPAGSSAAPAWLRRAQSMHWVGGIWMPGTLPSEASRPFALLDDFDALLYLTRVSADEIPADLPRVPPRRRH